MHKKGNRFHRFLPSYLKQQLYSKQIHRVLKPDHSFATGYDLIKKQKMATSFMPFPDTPCNCINYRSRSSIENNPSDTGIRQTKSLFHLFKSLRQMIGDILFRNIQPFGDLIMRQIIPTDHFEYLLLHRRQFFHHRIHQ